MVLRSLLTSIPCASSKATELICLPLMLHTNAPLSKKCNTSPGILVRSSYPSMKAFRSLTLLYQDIALEDPLKHSHKCCDGIQEYWLCESAGHKAETLTSISRCSSFKRTHHFLLHVWEALYWYMLLNYIQAGK